MNRRIFLTVIKPQTAWNSAASVALNRKPFDKCKGVGMLRHTPQAAQRPSATGLELAPQTASRIGPTRLLIIEDELLIALMIEEMCREGGYRISGVAHTDKLAKSELAKDNFDAVLLDVSIDGRYHPETADCLLTKGIPFAFVTGYDHVIDPRHENVPVLQKPFTPDQLLAFLKALVGPESSRGRRRVRPRNRRTNQLSAIDAMDGSSTGI